MAHSLGRYRLMLPTTKQHAQSMVRTFATTHAASAGSNVWTAISLAGAASGISLWLYKDKFTVSASDLNLEPPKYNWSFSGFFQATDVNSIRRGYQVYKQVCAACHSMDHMNYLQFVDRFMTLDEAKAEAAEVMVQDGPDEMGKMYERPGRITDYLPQPYPNAAAAKAANNGAAPPDLSVICNARSEQGGEDYIFSLLTGYEDAPGGVEVGEGQAYNPYFLGGVLSMAQQLYDEGIDYDDGTPATASQQAKDVTTFLKWSTEPYMDQWKLIRLKFWLTAPFFLASYYFLYRHVWTVHKTMKTYWHTLPYRGRPVQSLMARHLSPHQANNAPRIP